MDVRRALFPALAVLLTATLACGDTALVTPEVPDALFAKKDPTG